MSTRTYNVQADEDAEQAAWLAADKQQHPDAYRPVDWRGLLRTAAWVLAGLTWFLILVVWATWLFATGPVG